MFLTLHGDTSRSLFRAHLASWRRCEIDRKTWSGRILAEFGFWQLFNCVSQRRSFFKSRQFDLNVHIWISWISDYKWLHTLQDSMDLQSNRKLGLPVFWGVWHYVIYTIRAFATSSFSVNLCLRRVSQQCHRYVALRQISVNSNLGLCGDAIYMFSKSDTLFFEDAARVKRTSKRD